MLESDESDSLESDLLDKLFFPLLLLLLHFLPLPFLLRPLQLVVVVATIVGNSSLAMHSH